ncbi:MAG: [FeFe] hydrogenase H-cluster maturation GTPase HydF [Bacteroidia bacterium]|nr:[FeFe] hydrogenase H-cluster maturation GTPase HydF [Bacteroidia bacterium]
MALTGRDNKPHIGIYGRRNNGKSSLINLIAGQDIAIVSDHAGTTTDPVKKSFEISGFGPVVLIDTAGIDDFGELGDKRVARSKESLNTIDLAILVITANRFEEPEKSLVKILNTLEIPFFIVHNKSDLEPLDPQVKSSVEEETGALICDFSALTSDAGLLTDLIRKTIPASALKTPSLLGDLISFGDIVLLITPIDAEAPEGRLILPQVQAIRDILNNDGVAVILKEREIDSFLRKTGIKPRLAVTDSQVFVKADASVPPDIPLTSFSILLARYKGDFENYLKGTPKISELKDGDHILILESCSHHVSCDDIGRVKIPRWLSAFTGKKLVYEVVAGLNKLPVDIGRFALVIQCGGCMITRRQLHNRLKPAINAGVPVTNYGMAIAYVQGIYRRAISPLIPDHSEGVDYL